MSATPQVVQAAASHSVTETSGSLRLDLVEEHLRQGRRVRLRARGSSMWPAVRDGDILTLAPVSFDAAISSTLTSALDGPNPSERTAAPILSAARAQIPFPVADAPLLSAAAAAPTPAASPSAAPDPSLSAAAAPAAAVRLGLASPGVAFTAALPRPLRRGDLAAARAGDALVIHRVLATRGRAVLLQGDALPEPDGWFDAPLARVERIERAGRAISNGSGRLGRFISRLRRAGWPAG